MADKAPTLSIVLRTVDNATAGIQAFNKKLETITTPFKNLTKATDEFKDHLGTILSATGIPAVASAFRGVGSAVKDLFGKLLIVGGVATAAVVGVKSLVDKFDELGDKAERLGVHVDFLAQMRFAAERSGASVEALDSGMQTFATNLGLARAGMGKMVKALQTVAPDLLVQLKRTKSVEEATLLMADAMSALTDPTKKAALAARTGFGPELVPLLSRGSKGVAELMGQFSEGAGSLQAAADAAGEADDSIKKLGASTTGVQAALITGLAPALKIVVEQLSAWFVEHRADIEQWATDIGKKLPGAIDSVVTAIKSAVEWVAKLVDGLGGLKVVAGIAAAVMVGPLVASIVKLGVVLLATPFGLFLAGIAAVAAGVALLVRNFDRLVAAAKAVKDALNPFDSKSGGFALVQNIPGALPPALQARLGPPAGAAAALPQTNTNTNNAHVTLEIKGAPTGSRAAIDPRSTADVDLLVGHQMPGAGL